MLTGKCRNDFEKWLNEQEVAPYKSMVWSIPLTAFYSYFEDFLESNGVFSSIEYHEHIEQFSGKIKCPKTKLRLDTGIFRNRNEIRTDLIEKANEVYNNRNYDN